MKVGLFALFVILLLCFYDVDHTIYSSDLESREGLTYLKGGLLNKDTPLTGRAVTLFENGEKEWEGNYKDGKPDGIYTRWYENGQKKEERTYKDGKYHGLWIEYKKDGTESSRETYKDGKLVED